MVHHTCAAIRAVYWHFSSHCDVEPNHPVSLATAGVLSLALLSGGTGEGLPLVSGAASRHPNALFDAKGFEPVAFQYGSHFGG